MTKTTHLPTALAALTPMVGRRPDLSLENAPDAYASLDQINGATIFVARFSGQSEWERHPGGDELVYAVEGAACLTLLTSEGPQAIDLTAGSFTVVPQGHWHRFEAPEGVSLMTITPPPTDHHASDEPPSSEL